MTKETQRHTNTHMQSHTHTQHNLHQKIPGMHAHTHTQTHTHIQTHTHTHTTQVHGATSKHTQTCTHSHTKWLAKDNSGLAKCRTMGGWHVFSLSTGGGKELKFTQGREILYMTLYITSGKTDIYAFSSP